MSEYGNTSARGYTPRGRGGGRGGFNTRGRGGRGARGGNRGRGGYQQQQHNNYNPYRNADVDYSPEAIEQRFAPFYLPSVTKDPWQHLTQVTKQ